MKIIHFYNSMMVIKNKKSILFHFSFLKSLVVSVIEMRVILISDPNIFSLALLGRFPTKLPSF